MVGSYIKKEWKKILVAFVATVIISLAFVTYLYYVGIPMTEARNKYNKAQLAYDAGDKVNAKIYVQESLDLWVSEDATVLKKMLLPCDLPQTTDNSVLIQPEKFQCKI
jgi:hypothetical protein